MTVWRLLNFETHDAFTNMAIDEAVLTARIKGLVPNTLRLYCWKPSTVSIGRFQNVFNEVYVENCKRNSVDVVRRISGGGAVYHDAEDEITYSVVVGEENLKSRDPIVTYNIICRGLIEAIKTLGVNANFNPGNPKNCPNITINSKKISGSAQRRKGGVLLQHGTFLINTNLTKMFTCLRVPWAESIADVIRVARNRITSIQHELATNITKEEAYHALVKGFQTTFNTRFNDEDVLTGYERKLADKLRRVKYITKKWNLDLQRGSTKGKWRNNVAAVSS